MQISGKIALNPSIINTFDLHYQDLHLYQKGIAPLYLPLARPNVDYDVHIWAPKHGEALMHWSESRGGFPWWSRAAMAHMRRGWELGVFNHQKKRLRGDLNAVNHHIKRSTSWLSNTGTLRSCEIPQSWRCSKLHWPGPEQPDLIWTLEQSWKSAMVWVGCRVRQPPEALPNKNHSAILLSGTQISGGDNLTLSTTWLQLVFPYKKDK